MVKDKRPQWLRSWGVFQLEEGVEGGKKQLGEGGRKDE